LSALVLVRKDSGIEYQVICEHDIDSIINSCADLGIFKKGILWYPMQGLTSTIKNDLHIPPRPVRYTDNHGHLHQITVPLRNP
jgi:hypothetical protein